MAQDALSAYSYGNSVRQRVKAKTVHIITEILRLAVRQQSYYLIETFLHVT